MHSLTEDGPEVASITVATAEVPLNPLTPSKATERGTKPTVFAQITIQGVPHWALIDTGAELTVMGTAFAAFTGAISSDFSNLHDGSF